MVDFIGINATGWSKLMDTDLIGAVLQVFDASLMGWTIAILFFVYQGMLYIKTRNTALCFVTGLIFASLYAGSIFIKANSLSTMVALLIFELACIIYAVLWK